MSGPIDDQVRAQINEIIPKKMTNGKPVMGVNMRRVKRLINLI